MYLWTSRVSPARSPALACRVSSWLSADCSLGGGDVITNRPLPDTRLQTEYQPNTERPPSGGLFVCTSKDPLGGMLCKELQSRSPPPIDPRRARRARRWRLCDLEPPRRPGRIQCDTFNILCRVLTRRTD